MGGDKIYFKNHDRGESIQSYCKRRNGRLKELFERRGFKVYLKGDPQNPMILLQDGIILSGYVKNFELILTDQPYEGEVVQVIKLTEQNVNTFPVKELFDYLEKYEQIAGYRIKLNLPNDNLFVVGYSHSHRDNNMHYKKDALFPVFGRINPHVYKTEDYAEDVRVKLEANDYDVVLDQFDYNQFIESMKS